VCGIAGWIGPPGDPDVDRSTLAAMTDRLAHRGPDAEGSLLDGPVRLGHRRLAVLGLGAAGDQPMRSASGRYSLVYNGEIYNHLELRDRLERERRAPTWRGGSDTETLLAGVEAWGLLDALERSVGMFALALWDRETRRLTLARDRLGEKPLSWAMHGGNLLFASQPAALRTFPAFRPSVDPDALVDLLRFAQVPGARTIHREVQQLPPGSLLEIRPDANGRVGRAPEPEAWWSFLDVARDALADPLTGDDDALVRLTGSALERSVHGQLLADVPVGAFLSGGIDSSLVVATMTRVSDRPVRTFTIGFAEDGFDEAPHARAVAQHLGTEHTELVLSADDALTIVPELPALYDEPFADASQLPTSLVSRLARTSVTVALSGDGGDELFAGYDRYRRAELQARVPRMAARAGGGVLGLLGRRREQAVARTLGRGPAPIVRRMLSHTVDAERFVLGSDLDEGVRRWDTAWRNVDGMGTLTERFMAYDTIAYLPDDILHKVDRAAMAVSLETRVPLLDHRFVELAWRLPMRMKVRDGRTKWVLRELLARDLPRALFERPKAGFAVPIGRWLRGPLRPWAEDLLATPALEREGLLDVAAVRGVWEEHLRGATDRSLTLWPMLMFRAWAEVQ